MRLHIRLVVAGTSATAGLRLGLLVLTLVWARPAVADWARDMFEVTQHDFGEVEQGAEASRKLTVTRYGNGDWEIVDVLGSTDHVKCELGTPDRSGNRVSYSLTATLAPGAPPGGLGTQLLLVTNDPAAAKIPVMVEGSVRPSLSVAPASLYLGSLRPGQSVTKRLVVRAAKPFHIQDISAECDCFEFSYASEEAKILHLVPVKFSAGDKAGAVKRSIRVKTDLNGAEAEIIALAAIDNRVQ